MRSRRWLVWQENQAQQRWWWWWLWRWWWYCWGRWRWCNVSFLQLLFAFVPPPHLLGGWLTFFVSLLVIGLLTAIVGDLAAIFGCLVGLSDSITSITFVAMGTSLPDLFASKQAAMMEKTADNSIGNVTGSNSVNVFLGLGLPWVMAAIYWSVKVTDMWSYWI